MALITLRQLLDHAAENGYGLPAFNVNNMEQVLAIMRAADCGPVPGDPPGQPRRPLLRRRPDGPGDDSCRDGDVPRTSRSACTRTTATRSRPASSAIDQGYTSAMMDGSLLDDASTPSTYEYNVDITRKTADYAHERGVSVEGELGVLGRLDTGEGEKEDGHGAVGKLDRSQLLTDPDQAVDFVSQTQVDALAIAMGTSHGAYKFSQKPDSSVLAMSVVKEIHERLPDLHLVMHGSSSVPQDLQDVFNEFGGELPQTYGVPVEEILEGIKHGVRKVNIDTDTRLAMTGAYRKVAQTKKQEFDPRKFNIPAMEAVTDPLPDPLRAVRLGGPGAEDHAGRLRSDMARSLRLRRAHPASLRLRRLPGIPHATDSRASRCGAAPWYPGDRWLLAPTSARRVAESAAAGVGFPAARRYGRSWTQQQFDGACGGCHPARKLNRTSRSGLSTLRSTRQMLCQVPSARPPSEHRDGGVRRDQRRHHVGPAVTPAAVSMPPPVVGGQEVGQRREQVLVAAGAGLQDRESRGRVGYEQVQQPVAPCRRRTRPQSGVRSRTTS